MNSITGRRVLVVDDALPMRMLLKSYLGKLGVPDRSIGVAEDGEAGLRAFRENPPDLVFVDIEMPKMGGEETALAMLCDRPDLKVVVTTAVDASDERVRHLRSLGVFAVLSKPVRLEHVRELLDTLDAENTNLIRIG